MSDLWIRSQDRERLFKPDFLETDSTNYKPQVFIVNRNGDKTQYIGEYATEKRALEILDEIQELIEHQGLKQIKKGNYVSLKYIVYEMPEE